MLINVKCPECRDTVPVTESVSEQRIDCPACGENFSVPGSGAPAPKAAPPKSKDRDRDRDEPRGKKSNPRRSRRDDDDDDDDDRGRPRRKEEERGSGMVGLLIFGGIGLAVLAVGFGITAWLIFSGDDKGKPEVADNSTRPVETRPDVPQNKTTPPNNAKPGVPNNVPGLPQDVDPPIKPKNTKPKVEGPPPAVEPPPAVDPPPRVEPPPKAPRVEPPPKNNPADGPPPAAESPFVQLPGPASEQTAVGAGGKYLFLHLKTNRQVAVFDPAEKKVVKYIRLSDENAVIAAGLEHLIIGYPELNKLERVPYATFESDKTVDVPSRHALQAIGLGSSAKNPLLVAASGFPHGDEFFLMDVATMKRYDNTVVKNPGISPDPKTHILASQDGRTFAVEGGRFGGGRIFQMRTTGWQVNDVKFPLAGITGDGETVLGPGQLSGISGQAFGGKKGGDKNGVWYLPAAQGPYFCSLNERTYGEWPKERKFSELQIHIGRDQQALASFPELPELNEFVDFFFKKTKPLDRHIFFFPEANLVAILPASRERIHFRTVDVKAELAKTTINYLAVASRPPSVKFGETFRYKPEVLCKKRPSVLRLDAAPVGMKLEGDTLVWTVPTRSNQPPANVILSVTDAAGQEIFHSFEVTVFAK